MALEDEIDDKNNALNRCNSSKSKLMPLYSIEYLGPEITKLIFFIG